MAKLLRGIINKNAAIKSLCTIRLVNDFCNVIVVMLIEINSHQRKPPVRLEGEGDKGDVKQGHEIEECGTCM